MLRWSFAIACACALVFITAPAAAYQEVVQRPPYCYLPKVTGLCKDLLAVRPKLYIPSYYYDARRDACLYFVYGGCHGNNNRFSSKEACEYSCRPGKQYRPIVPTHETFPPWLIPMIPPAYDRPDRPQRSHDYDDREYY